MPCLSDTGVRGSSAQGTPSRAFPSCFIRLSLLPPWPEDHRAHLDPWAGWPANELLQRS